MIISTYKNNKKSSCKIKLHNHNLEHINPTKTARCNQIPFSSKVTNLVSPQSPAVSVTQALRLSMHLRAKIMKLKIFLWESKTRIPSRISTSSISSQIALIRVSIGQFQLDSLKETLWNDCQGHWKFQMWCVKIRTFQSYLLSEKSRKNVYNCLTET